MIISRVEFTGDPVDLYATLAPLGSAVLLDDSEGGPDAGWSIVGLAPRATLRWHRGAGELRHRGGGVEVAFAFFPAARRLLGLLDAAGESGDLPFDGGLIGYFGYDLRHETEALPDRNPPDSSLPDAWLGLYDLVVLANPGRDPGWVQVVDRSGGTAPICPLLAALRHPVQASEAPRRRGLRPVSNLEPAAYVDRVRRIQELIRAGDVYQVNLTQRFLVRCPDDPLALYNRLRRRHPAPYGAFLPVGGAAILSLSPETFLRVNGRSVESRPIKGTTARSRGEDDERARAALLASEKDRAELAMIVDLVRNDLSRVCRAGTVRVPTHAVLQSAPTVHHLVSSVVGDLDDGFDVFDLLGAALPGGSITGAPKIRAMEVIDELETLRRGVYTGAIGYIGVGGRAELNIAIRTVVVEAGYARIHGGGGIVIDSDPAAEFDESVVKVRGLLAALGAELEGWTE